MPVIDQMNSLFNIKNLDKFKGQLQRALEFKHTVLIEGLDNSSHNVRIISPNADARLDLLQFILQIEDLTNHATDHPDTKGTGAKLSRLLKEGFLSFSKFLFF